MRQKPLVKAYNESWDDLSLLLYLPFDVLLGSMFRKFNKSDGCHHISMLWHKLMHNWTIWCELLNILASDGIKHDPNVTRILGGVNTVIQDCICTYTSHHTIWNHYNPHISNNHQPIKLVILYECDACSYVSHKIWCATQ